MKRPTSRICGTAKTSKINTKVLDASPIFYALTSRWSVPCSSKWDPDRSFCEAPEQDSYWYANFWAAQKLSQSQQEGKQATVFDSASPADERRIEQGTQRDVVLQALIARSEGEASGTNGVTSSDQHVTKTWISKIDFSKDTILEHEAEVAKSPVKADKPNDLSPTNGKNQAAFKALPTGKLDVSWPSEAKEGKKSGSLSSSKRARKATPNTKMSSPNERKIAATKSGKKAEIEICDTDDDIEDDVDVKPRASSARKASESSSATRKSSNGQKRKHPSKKTSPAGKKSSVETIDLLDSDSD